MWMADQVHLDGTVSQDPSVFRAGRDPKEYPASACPSRALEDLRDSQDCLETLD